LSNKNEPAVPLVVLFPQSVYHKMERSAAYDGTSLNTFVVMCVEYYLSGA
jgi:hypothetical protein